MISADANQRARDLIVFAAALDDVGLPDLARRSRVVAGDLLVALHELEWEREALGRMEADRDRWRDNRWREVHREAWPS